MGTQISLDVGGISLAWSKNMRGMDHGALYQESDRKRLRSVESVDDKEEDFAWDMAFTRPLRSVVPRLEMLGFRLDVVHHDYEAATRQWREDRLLLADALEADDGQVAVPMSFDEYMAFVRAHPISNLSDEAIMDFDESSKQMIRGRFDANEEVARIPGDLEGLSWAYSEKSYFGALIDFLHPYAILRLLAECPENLDLTVDWQYGPLVENGWATVNEFSPCARRNESFLIATEGSSDVHILGHAIKLLRPDVADFFRFIDVSERHPFSGTGSLVRFAEGLAKIDVQNKIIFLLDNDAEGVEAFREISRFKLPPNMSTLVLPDLDEFRQFPAKGPDGIKNSDINRRAAAIECYLDLKLPQYGAASVVWMNYKRESGVYHGALEHKESYTKAFLKQTAESIRDGQYDVSKIERVLDVLIDDCSRLAAAEFSAEFAAS